MKATLRESSTAPLLHDRAMPFDGDETRLATPTLYLVGDQDGCVLPEAARGQERYFSGPFEAEVVPGVGRFPHLERPDLVIPRVTAWLDQHRWRVLRATTGA